MLLPACAHAMEHTKSCLVCWQFSDKTWPQVGHKALRKSGKQVLQQEMRCTVFRPSLEAASLKITSQRIFVLTIDLRLGRVERVEVYIAVQGGTCIRRRAHLPELVHVSLAGTTAAGLYLRRAPALAESARVLAPRALPRALPSGTGVLKQIPMMLRQQRCLHCIQGPPGLSPLS